MKIKSRFLLGIVLALVLTIMPVQDINAGTVYLSDGIEHAEGYIFIGESHMVLSANAYSRSIDQNNKVIGLEDVYYHYLWDSSVYSYDGHANTFIMSGNLFFVFEGNAEYDAVTQKSKEYIYSDGKGNHGVAVAKIHEIINNNPNIKHWNIISYHGAVSALEWETTAPYYIQSYNNWIEYEFPEADCFFVSHSTMTKFYKQKKTAYMFNEAIEGAFQDCFFDYTDFYEKRMATNMIDTIHWNDTTYIELINDIIKKIDLIKTFNESVENKSIYEKKIKQYENNLFQASIKNDVDERMCV